MIVAAAALVALAACSSGDDSGESVSAPTSGSAVSPEPPPAPLREDGRMPEETFAEFTALDQEVADGIAQWSADAAACTKLGTDGDLPGFRDCIANVLTEADEALSNAGSNTGAVSAQVSAECLAAAQTYAMALANLRAAASLARGFADSLDVKSMPAALRSLAKGRKAYKTASTQVRGACKPS